jgi:hypothetical protein
MPALAQPAKFVGVLMDAIGTVNAVVPKKPTQPAATVGIEPVTCLHSSIGEVAEVPIRKNAALYGEVTLVGQVVAGLEM